MSAESAAAQRLFVALWPDAGVRAALQAEQRRWHWPQGAAPTPPDKLHLTLHFIGEVDAARAQAIAADLPRPRPITVVFDRREAWANGCAVLQASEVPETLHALRDALGRSLQGLDVALEARAFRPHLTLARKALGAVPPADAPPLRWTADALVLVRSHAGRYTVLGGDAQ